MFRPCVVSLLGVSCQLAAQPAPSGTVEAIERLDGAPPVPSVLDRRESPKAVSARIYHDGFEARFSISGTLNAAAATDTERDVNDPFATYASNNTAGTAVLVPNIGTIGGYASAVGAGLATARFATQADPWDIFRTYLVAGQRLSLSIGGYDQNAPASVDLDLLLYAVSNINTPAQSSVTVNATEALSVATSGEYYVAVYGRAGGSAYVLTLDSATSTASTKQSVRAAVPGQFVLLFDSEEDAAATAATLWRKTPVGDIAVRVLSHGGPLVLVEAVGLTTASISERLGTTPARGLRPPTSEAAALKALATLSQVRQVEPNGRMAPLFAPADTYYRLQWHLPEINWQYAADVTLGAGAVVAVVDTGVSAHPDLSVNLRSDGFDFILDPQMARDGGGLDSDPSDPGDGDGFVNGSFHGAHVAGTVAARDNGIGVIGVAPRAQILPIRVLGAGGGTYFDIAQGIYYAARLANNSGTLPAMRADVINLSLGGPGASAVLQAATDAARAAGSIMIAAAGNDASSEVFSPAASPGVIGVSALDARFYAAPYTNFGSSVDIAAPGGALGRDDTNDGYPDGVLSTRFSQTNPFATPVPNYDFLQGTSMAAPHVAGVAALMRSVYPGMTPANFDALLVNGSLTWDIAGNNYAAHPYFGRGALDAYRAVYSASQAASVGVPGVLFMSPSWLYFNLATNQATLRITNVGQQPIQVTGVTPAHSYVSVGPYVTEPTALAYPISVDRTGLTPGRHETSLRVTSNRGTATDVRVYVDVGAPVPVVKNAGLQYVLALDADTFEVAGGVAVYPNSQGGYAYTIPNVPSGTYLLVSGTDNNYDGYVCDPGEACGGYPTLNDLSALQVATANLTVPAFVAGYTSLAKRGGVRSQGVSRLFHAVPQPTTP